MEIAVTQVEPGQGVRFGARKYAVVESFSHPGVEYRAAKVRVRNSRDYRYVCTCPDHVYRQRTCKHIDAFQQVERG